MDIQERYDVVVIGGGAAGLSGGVALARARREVLVIDAGDPRNAPAAGVHNVLGHDGVTPQALLAAGRAELAGYGGRLIEGTAVSARPATGPDDAGFEHAGFEHAGFEHAGFEHAGFEVELADGRTVRARRLLVTTGLTDEVEPLPGLVERWGRDVLHCPYCHGWEVRDQAIGVLASGPMAVHQALLWRQWSSDVTLFLHTTQAPDAEQQEQLDARGITVLPGPVQSLEIEGGRLTGVRLQGGRVVPRQALAVAPRLVARGGVLSDLGLKPVDALFGELVIGSRIAAGPTGDTEVPGVWVAGNVTDPQAQVIGAASAGLSAGAAINADLVAEDTRRAVAAHRARSPRTA